MSWSTSQPTDQDPFEPERHALARLLQARGDLRAAKIVAVSTYRADCVDNLDGGQYEVVLDVPPELYDVAREQLRDTINRACEDIIGERNYWGLNIRVLCGPYSADWVAKIVDESARRWVPSERVGAPGISTG